MTVAIAVERFIGLCRPFRRLSTRPCPAKAYIFPVLIFSIGLNIPKFLESETKERNDLNLNGEINRVHTIAAKNVWSKGQIYMLG